MVALKRAFDLVLALTLLVLLAPLLAALAGLVKLTSEGPVLYWSRRIGRGNVEFRMPKFRSMRVGTPDVATHLLDDARHHLTLVGGFLRRTSLDELPQLWSVLRGEMSLVGPRPALHNQEDLIRLRREHGLDELLPGITGWAQIHGRDELSIPEKVRLDAEYLRRHGFFFDLAILWRTAFHVVSGAGVQH